MLLCLLLLPPQLMLIQPTKTRRCHTFSEEEQESKLPNCSSFIPSSLPLLTSVSGIITLRGLLAPTILQT
ncbi:hypothetical protein L1987_24883 [Smallanthus sonchifolius]|uniref:Uncharacterized protein n=1 Tax=Smallanthus sonchifolius TaxID=185202 RepID=A0ACB9ILQ3_9ASTR|nr:hypothetical protein L1987_24883 [Smallanthus sonchifolius]